VVKKGGKLESEEVRRLNRLLDEKTKDVISLRIQVQQLKERDSTTRSKLKSLVQQANQKLETAESAERLPSLEPVVKVDLKN
jgi:hypothetical protein